MTRPKGTKSRRSARGRPYAQRELPHGLHRNYCPANHGGTSVPGAGRNRTLCSESPLERHFERIYIGFPFARSSHLKPVRDMAWRSQSAICAPRRGRGDLSPRPPLLKERGRKAERCLTGVLYALGLTENAIAALSQAQYVGQSPFPLPSGRGLGGRSGGEGVGNEALS